MNRLANAPRSAQPIRLSLQPDTLLQGSNSVTILGWYAGSPDAQAAVDRGSLLMPGSGRSVLRRDRP
jgi:hypothetical protein